MRTTKLRACALAVLLVACDAPSAMDDDAGGIGHDAGSSTRRDSGSSEHDAAIDATTPANDAGGNADTLAARHPGDVGLADDPAVVWMEDFEEGSIDAIAARYDDTGATDHWELVTDAPSGTALALTAGAGTDAVDFFKQLPDADEWYVRWYARYDRDVPWHHSGVWFGGYNPSSRWPNPQAGLRPNGDDRFSVSVEPVFESPSLRFDFYDYWMRMHSWMDEPPADDGTAYYGNTLVHRNDFTVDEETWVCLEVHLRLNPDPSSGAGAVLEVWKNDGLVARFDGAGPSGYWVRDKFCPADADGAECTDYPAPPDDHLDLQMRSTTDLHLNAFWPQNYITDSAEGTLAFDQMVVATERIGCMR